MNYNYRTFAIVSEPRTGSTVISNKFGLIQGIHVQGEIFHPDEIYCSVSADSIPSLKERNQKPIEFLGKILDQTFIAKDEPEIIGFKLFFDHNPTITQHVIDKRIPVILLERKNKLAQYSSLKIAKKTGKWHSKQKLTPEQIEANEKHGSKIKFSLLELIAFSFRSYYRFNSLAKTLKKNGVPFHYLEYEKMFIDEKWNEVVKFLEMEVPENNLEPTLKKQRKGNVLDGFSNPGYAKFCCKLMMIVPPFAKFLGIDKKLFENS